MASDPARRGQRPVRLGCQCRTVHDRQRRTVPHGRSAPLDSADYTTEYNEVQELGSIDAERSPEQQAVADFYNTHAAELFNRTLRTVAGTEGLSVADEARLLAMVNLVAADSIITCWSEKAYWHFWRPETAIHEGDNDNNDETVGDPAWEPMLPTPPYPDHTSGFNCVSSAFMYGADAFFGGEPIAFSVVRIAPHAPEVTRDYERFADVVDDTIDARVFQGIHVRAADVQGAEIGANVAEWVATNYFQPASAASTTT
jgi:hypothetical protein